MFTYKNIYIYTRKNIHINTYRVRRKLFLLLTPIAMTKKLH